VDEQRIVITSGQLSDAELAAVVVALELHREAADTAPPPPSRWARAARLENRGHPPIDQPTRLSW